MTEPSPDKPAKTAKARLGVEAAQYARWTAVQPVMSPSGALAYAPGYPVPAANVDEAGRVVLRRHQCDTDHPETQERCEAFNEPIEWTDPGVAVRAR